MYDTSLVIKKHPDTVDGGFIMENMCPFYPKCEQMTMEVVDEGGCD
jgi:hypothetical protein